MVSWFGGEPAELRSHLDAQNVVHIEMKSLKPGSKKYALMTADPAGKMTMRLENPDGASAAPAAAATPAATPAAPVVDGKNEKK